MKATDTMANQVGNKVAEAATEQAEVVIKDLRKAAKEATAQLNAYRQSLEVALGRRCSHRLI